MAAMSEADADLCEMLKDISVSDSTKDLVAKNKSKGKCRVCTGVSMNGFEDYNRGVKELSEHLKVTYMCDAVEYHDQYLQ